MIDHRLFAALLVVGLCLIGVVAPAAATTADLEVQAALEDDTDTAESSYTFEVAGNGEVEVEITTSTSQTAAGGDVEHEYLGWEAVDGTNSGTGSTWTAQAGESYRVTYESTASGDAEGTYTFDFEAQDGNNTYATTFETNVEVLEPAFGNLETEGTEIVFAPDDSGTETNTTEITIPNEGDGIMLPTELTFQGEPSGIEATAESVPDEIAAGATGEATAEIAVDDSVDAGSYDLTATVNDNLDNSETVTIEVEVFKPPAVEPASAELDVGEILIGESGSATVEIEEVTGRTDVDSLLVGTDRERDGELTTRDLERLNIPAGGSETAEVTVAADEEAPRGGTLEWEVGLTPDAARAPTTFFDVTADVLYPPLFGELTAKEAEIQFDEPRSETKEFSEEVVVTVPNIGDLEMNVVDASASISGEDVDAEVISEPETIAGRSDASVSVAVTADAEASAGTRALTVTVESEEDGTEELTTGVELVKYPSVGVSSDTVEFGEVPISADRSRTVNIEEELGYRDVERFEMSLVSSPDQGWLTYEELPTALSAGEGNQIGLDLSFDAEADLFTTYEWTFRIKGSNIATKDVVVSAVPRPVECTDVVENLESYDGGDDDTVAFAEEIATAIRAVEEQARENQGDADAIDDVSRACTAGRGALLFVTADEDIRGTDDPEQQQEHVARMAFGFSTVQRYGTQIQDDDARTAVDRGINIGDAILDERISTQESAVTTRLEDATVLEEARAKTQLARLSGIRGNDEAASAARAEANAAFDEYLSLVSDGNENLAKARDRNDELAGLMLVSIRGQQVFWIGDYDQFQTSRDAVLERYDSAIDSFETAGAEERAEAAAAERASVATTFQSTLIFSGVLAGAVGIGFLFVVIYEARAVYRYIQDVSTVQTGSFLI